MLYTENFQNRIREAFKTSARDSGSLVVVWHLFINIKAGVPCKAVVQQLLFPE